MSRALRNRAIKQGAITSLALADTTNDVEVKERMFSLAATQMVEWWLALPEY